MDVWESILNCFWTKRLDIIVLNGGRRLIVRPAILGTIFKVVKEELGELLLMEISKNTFESLLSNSLVIPGRVIWA